MTKFIFILFSNHTTAVRLSSTFQCFSPAALVWQEVVRTRRGAWLSGKKRQMTNKFPRKGTRFRPELGSPASTGHFLPDEGIGFG